MARRRYQRGSVSKRGGVWIGRWREDVVDAGGAVRRIKKSQVLGDCSKMTQRLAQREMDRLTQTVNSVSYKPTLVATFGQFAERWQATMLPQYRASTQLTMRVHISSHIMPAFGNTAMSEINAEVVQAWVVTLKLMPSTISRVLTTLKAMWATAKEWGYVNHSLSGRIKLPQALHKEPRMLSIQDVKRLLEIAPEPMNTITRTAYETGLRIGEVLGLRGCDVHLDEGFIAVRQAIWHCAVQPTKTAHSIRAIPASPSLIAKLGKLASAETQEALLFHTASGRPYSQSNLLRTWHKLLRNAGLPQCGFHTMRHGNASWMAVNNVPTRIAQERLGHSDPRMTLKVYQHVEAEQGRWVAERLGNALDSIPTVYESEKNTNHFGPKLDSHGG